jgi:hypothetical protein
MKAVFRSAMRVSLTLVALFGALASWSAYMEHQEYEQARELCSSIALSTPFDALLSHATTTQGAQVVHQNATQVVVKFGLCRCSFHFNADTLIERTDAACSG